MTADLSTRIDTYLATNTVTLTITAPGYHAVDLFPTVEAAKTEAANHGAGKWIGRNAYSDRFDFEIDAA